MSPDLPRGPGDPREGDGGPQPPAHRGGARPPGRGDGRPRTFYPAEAWEYPGAAPEEEIGLAEIARILRRRTWTVLGTLAAVVLAAGAYTWWTPPVWEASTTIRVEDQRRGGASGAGGMAPEAGFLLGLGMGGQIETEMRVAETRPILAEVVDGLDLNVRVLSPAEIPRSDLFRALEFGRETPEATYELERVGGDRWRVALTDPDSLELERAFTAGERVEIIGGSFTLATEETTLAAAGEAPDGIEVETLTFTGAVNRLREELRVSRPDPDAALMRVAYEGTDRPLVREVPNALADAFLARRREVQTTEARSTVAFLEEQNGRIESQLEAAERELQSFREAEQVVAPEAQAEAQVGRLAELRAERSQLVAERDALSNLIRSIDAPDREPDYRKLAAFPTFLQNQAVQDLLQVLNQADRQRTEMLSRRTERHPDVVSLTEQIQRLEGRLGEIGTNYLASLNDQIASLDAELARFGSALEEVPGQEVQYARLQRRTELLAELHTMLQKRLKEAQISEAVEDPSVRVVEAAVLPEEPVSPKPVRNLALAGFLGLMLGVGLAFVREYTDRTIHEEEDVDRAMGLPVLSRVPKIAEAADGAPRKRGLVTRASGHSIPAEAYRSLRTNVRYTRAGSGAREILVTSPGAREGKSVTASNLAVTFAQQGQRTVLIDADLRKAVQHEAFDVERFPGLSDLLIDDYPLHSVVRATEIEHLDLVPAGVAPPNPAELLGSERMENFLEHLRDTYYEVVVIDAPPTLVVTDAAVLAPKVEGTLIVVRADRTNRDAAADTRQQLERVGAEILGVVFNDAPVDGRYGYRYEDYRDYLDVDAGNGKRGIRRLMPFG